MARFRLLFGQHIGEDDKGEQRTYSAGDVIESDVDLVRRFGAGKFQNLDNDVRVIPRDPSKGGPNLPDAGAANAFPAGQVSEGVQTSVAGEPANNPAVKLNPEQLKARLQAQQHQGKLGVVGGKQSPPPDEEALGEVTEESKKSAEEARKQPGSSPEAREKAGSERAAQEKMQGQQNSAQQQKQAPAKKPDFEKMSLAEMRQYAEGEEIDLKGANNRADVLKVLKSQD